MTDNNVSNTQRERGRESNSVEPKANDRMLYVEHDVATLRWRRGGAVTVEMQDTNPPGF